MLLKRRRSALGFRGGLDAAMVLARVRFERRFVRRAVHADVGALHGVLRRSCSLLRAFRSGLAGVLAGVYGALASFLGGLSSLLRFFLGACVLGDGDAAGGAERRDRECRDESTHDGVLHQASYQTRCPVRLKADTTDSLLG